MANKLVSIAAISYNHAGEKPWLKQCLESILAQDYRPLEVVLAIDASPDDSFALAASYVSKFVEAGIAIQIINNPTNLGGFKNYDKAIDNCKGEYIAFLETDDWYRPNKISQSIKFMESHGYDAICGETTHYREWNQQYIPRYWETIGIGVPDIIPYGRLIVDNVCYTCTVVFRADKLRSVPSHTYWGDKGYLMGDYPLILSFTKKGYSFGYMREDLSYYRVSGQGASSQPNFAASYLQIKQDFMENKE